jgi:DNA invertase Pin-like site-specific DNA recombinase
MLMRAAAYARYSSDLQREASIEDQLRPCRERIEQEGWRYVHAYTDRAVSGASALRPAYQQLLEDARRERFDIVVAEALDRLSRDQEDVAGLFKRLRFAGIRLFTLAEDFCISQLTRARFGHVISPHLFRDAAAASVAIEDPEHVHVTKSILGHTTLRTSERYYVHAQSLEASRR